MTNACVRGADPNFTLVLLDGIPLNDSTDLQGGAVNLEELPAGLVERAEIVRGPLTSFYGPSSLSGVIQLFTPRGGPGPLPPRARRRGRERRPAARVRPRVGRRRAAGGWSTGAAYDEETHRIAEDRFRQLDACATADLALGRGARPAPHRSRSPPASRTTTPTARAAPSTGPARCATPSTTTSPSGRACSSARPPERRQQLTVGLSRRDHDRASPAVLPARSGVDRADDVHAPPPLVADAPRAQPDARPSTCGRLRRGRVGREPERAEAAAVPRRRRARRLRRDALERRSLRRAAAASAGRVLFEVALRADVASTDSPQLHPHAGVVCRPGSGSDAPPRLRRPRLEAAELLRPREPARPRRQPRPAARAHVGRRGGGRAGPRSAGASSSARRYFLHEYRDLVDFDFDLFIHVNRARVRTRGAELTARWQPHRDPRPSTARRRTSTRRTSRRSRFSTSRAGRGAGG